MSNATTAQAISAIAAYYSTPIGIAPLVSNQTGIDNEGSIKSTVISIRNIHLLEDMENKDL
ncbi:MAG: hypothetical protein WC405_04735 [Syntrophales bacterium]